jgi:hypothetical protein
LSFLALFEVDLHDWEGTPSIGPGRVLVHAGGRVLAEVILRAPSTPETFDHFAAVPSGVTADPGDPVAAAGVAIVMSGRAPVDRVEASLRSLSALRPPAGEVLVVESPPTREGVRRLCEAHGATLVEAGMPGIDHARNAGWRASSRAVVAFVEQGSIVLPWCASAFAAGFAVAPEVAAVTGLVLTARAQTAAEHAFERGGGMRRGFEPRLFGTDDPERLVQIRAVGVSSNMAFRRSVLLELDGFDEAFGAATGAAALDAFARVHRAGGVIAYEPSAVLRRHHEPDMRSALVAAAGSGRSYRAYLAKAHADGWIDSRRSRRAVRRWWGRRHVVDLARLVRIQEWHLSALRLAEAWGALQGPAAFRSADGGDRPAIHQVAPHRVGAGPAAR